MNNLVGGEFGGWLPGGELHRSANARIYSATRARESGVLKVCASAKPESTTYKRFLREIETLLALTDDPGVMQVLDSGVPEPPGKGRYPWYVMPEAVPFDEAFEGAAAAEVAAAVASIAATLSRLHQRDLHHRDVKPANLFRLGDDRSVLGDLGLVGRPPGVDPRVTESGDKLGPANFIAPEMLAIEPEAVDARLADVYSLAKVLWVLLAGRRYPMPGPQRAADPSSLAALRSDGAMTDLDRLIERSTANEPSARPNMNEFASELEIWLERQRQREDTESLDLEQVVADARARLSSHFDEQRSRERDLELAEGAIGSLRDRLEPLYEAMESIGTSHDMNSYEHLVASALQWYDGEVVGGSRIVEKWEHLSYAQVGSEPNAVRLHLAVRLVLFEDGTVSFGIGIDVTSWPMAAGSSRFHWREIEEDVPVDSIRLARQIERMADTALAQAPEAIQIFTRMGESLR